MQAFQRSEYKRGLVSHYHAQEEQMMKPETPQRRSRPVAEGGSKIGVVTSCRKKIAKNFD
jgi:hypothetical protein